VKIWEQYPFLEKKNFSGPLEYKAASILDDRFLEKDLEFDPKEFAGRKISLLANDCECSTGWTA